MDLRDFLGTVGTGLLAARAQAADSSKTRRVYRLIDTRLHVFNTKLEGAKGVPSYIQKDASVEAASKPRHERV